MVTKDADHLAVWVYLLTHAAYSDMPVMFNGQKVQLKSGQLITGRKRIASDTGVDEMKVKRILKLFKSDQQIDQQATPNGSLISIINWHRYQISEQQNDQRMTNDRPTSDQRVTTIKEKEEYIENQDSYSLRTWNDQNINPKYLPNLEAMRARIKKVNDEWRTKHE